MRTATPIVDFRIIVGDKVDEVNAFFDAGIPQIEVFDYLSKNIGVNLSRGVKYCSLNAI